MIRQTASCCRLLLALLASWLMLPLAAQELDLFGDDALADFELEETTFTDPALLKHTYYSELQYWPSMASQHPGWNRKDIEYRWQRVVLGGQPAHRLFVKPLGDKPLENAATVPVDGAYRVWLCYQGETGTTRPVTVALGGANRLTHTFGATPIPRGSAREVARKSRFRFDSQVGALVADTQPAVVWEYWDIYLKAGETAIAVTSGDAKARVDALFITQSKTFVPSRSAVKGEGNLDHTWYRYRVREAGDVVAVNLVSQIHYTWGYPARDGSIQGWFSTMGGFATPEGSAAIPVGTWTAWKQVATEVSGNGPYLSDRLTVTDARTQTPLTQGVVDVQLAWLDSEHAVLRSIASPLDDGITRYLAPAERYCGYRASYSTAATPAPWGARHPEYVRMLRTESQFLEDLLASIDDAKLPAGTMPRRIELWTTVATARSGWPAAVALLKKAGINAFPGFPYAYKQEIGAPPEQQMFAQAGTIAVNSHDPMDPAYESALRNGPYGIEALTKRADGDERFFERRHWLKMGDEIGIVTSPTHINGLPDSRARYLAYMAEQAGGDPAFFGVASFDHLVCDLERRPNRTLPERRRFYHDSRFVWWFTAEFHARHSRAARPHLPNLLTRCNYTPGGPMFAGDMGESNWFALARYNATTAHSSEDWLGTKGFTSQAGTQTESYYGAILECAVRRHGQPVDFNLVGRSGSLDRKLCLLVGSGIHSIYAYDWGPEYSRGAVDTFSQLTWTYEELNRGMRAIGPAEDVLVDGQRQPNRAAILYNRTNEIWRGGDYGVFSDRLYTYLALKHSFVNADLVLEDDLTAQLLRPYRVLYLNGLNLRRETIPALRAWVEAGGTLVAAGGTAIADEYDNPMPEADDLLGARAFPRDVSTGQWMPFYISGHQPIDRLTLRETALTPAIVADVIGLSCVLEPTTGEVIGTYADGQPGAVLRQLGAGSVLTFGIGPGLAYAQNAPRDEEGMPTNYQADRRLLVSKPALAALGELPAVYSEPLADLVVFEHADAIAVILVDFSYRPGQPATLILRTDRQVTSVTGSLRGPYRFTQAGNEVRIDCPIPEPVDILLIK